ncbi:MAG: hypothetical protein H7Y13_12325 [Sphingobacteriaceae bacterium]|nr:hypothetical protein [Sphingobacteriaceae bacterium]
MKYSMEDIARFAEGDMDGDERAEFEKVLQADIDLKSGLASYQNIHSSLKMKLSNDDKDKDFKQTLDEVSADYFKQKSKVIPITRYLAWTSAIAAVFVLFLIWSPWQKDLYRQYADTEMIAMVERGENSAALDMQQAANAFNKKDFSVAKATLENVIGAEPGNATARYYYAISLIETGDGAKARIFFSELYKGTSVFKYDAAFYTALSFIKEKNTKSAIVWLRKIPADAAKYDESRELLNKLK